MPMITTDPTTNSGLTLNIARSTSIAFELFSFLGLDKLINIITSTISPKVMDILSKNGKFGKALLVQLGKNFNTVEIGMVNNAPASAAAELVRFQ